MIPIGLTGRHALFWAALMIVLGLVVMVAARRLFRDPRPRRPFTGA